MARHRLDQVLQHDLCSGCGACAFVGREHGVTMVDIPTIGMRPVGAEQLPEHLKDELAAVCPGSQVRSPTWPQDPPGPAELLVGPSERIWEGWAADPQLRWAGSSGGAVTALAAYALERLDMALVVHTGMDPDEPWRNRTVVSVDRAELLEHCGSRYVPSSPVEALDVIEAADRPCVFIGKPCDVAAVDALRRQRPVLDRNLGLVLSFFCAGPPPTGASRRLAAELGFPDRTAIAGVRYRGRGWPGEFTVTSVDGRSAHLEYEESWGRLVQTPRQLRCSLCPDGLGGLADVTGGDAWHRSEEGSDGISLILARTARGAQVVRAAITDGYLDATVSDAERVVRAQPLTRRRMLVPARTAALRTVGLPAPRYPGFRLSAAAHGLGPRAWAKEYLGMLRRIVTRGHLRVGGRRARRSR
jgi:coenzyme F420 hydrogenase subunit beta